MAAYNLWMPEGFLDVIDRALLAAATAAAANMQDAMSQHTQAFRAQFPLDNTTTTSSSSSRNSSSSPAVLLLKGQLEQHARHVVDIVHYRAGALQREAAAASSTSDTTPCSAAKVVTAVQLQQGAEDNPANSHAAMLQQAQVQRSQHVEADKQALAGAAQRAVQLMAQQVVALEAQGWPNAYLAGKLVEVRASPQAAVAALL